MATVEDLRRVALALPGVTEGEDVSFAVPGKKGKITGIAWKWRERIDPKKPKVPSSTVWAIPVPNLTAKEVILGSDPEIYFTEPHYNGYAAVLMRLAAISVEGLEEILEQAWRCQADPKLVAESDAK